MKKLTLILFGAAALLGLLIAGCSIETPGTPTFSNVQTGDAGFANYVAIGNSLTAGYMDGALMMSGQTASYPLALATSFGFTTTDWTQPLIASPGIGGVNSDDPSLLNGVMYTTDGAGLGTLTSDYASVQSLLLAATSPKPYQNLGIPGATLYDVANALDQGSSQSGNNSFFDFILRNPNFENLSMMGQAINQGPTLITLWIGANDVLGGATSGAPEIGVNVTPPATFLALYESLVTSIETSVQTATTYKPTIVVANIPAMTSAPYFIPVAVFNAATGNAFTFAETDVAYVLLPALSTAPGELPGSLTLTTAETAVASDAVTAYNEHIATVAANHGLQVVDAHALLGNLTDAQKSHLLMLVGSGLTVTDAAAATAFSLDGIHPNNQGYSIIANAFINAINTALGTNVDPVAINTSWDPTYGQTKAATTTSDRPVLTKQAASAADYIFR